MKRLAGVCLMLHLLLTYCNNDQSVPADKGYNNTDTTQGKAMDTSSYERMPNKTTDSTPQ